MRICIVAEGSYPYVTGGVSSWIQSLITSLPEHEFIIYSIAAEEKDKGKFKYNLPENIIEVKEIFLDSYFNKKAELGRKYNLNAFQKKAIKSLLTEGPIEWNHFFSMFKTRKIKVDSAVNFVASSDLYEVIEELSMESNEDIPFTELFWSIRSMFLPLLGLLNEPIPKADIYHSVSTGYSGMVTALAKFLYFKPVILTEHGIYTREREEEIIKADWIQGEFKDFWIQYFYKLSDCIYKYSDQVITLFRKNKEIQLEIGCEPKKIKIIPNGVRTEDFEFLPGKTEKEKEYIHVGAVVRVVPIKDIKTMLQSFSIVKRVITNTKFYIFGPYEEDLEYYEECLQLVDSMEIQDVYFTGTVNVKDYINKMDILVLSSISEGQPLAVLEGLACRKPYVCTDVGSCRELIYGLDDGIGPAGIIVPVMNDLKMADAIIRLANDAELRETMGVNGRKRVEAHYTNEQFIDEYKNIYEMKRAVPWRELAFN